MAGRRAVFTHQALPANRLTNHFVDGDTIVIGLTPGSVIASEVVTGYRLVPSEPVNEIVRAAV